LIFWEVILIEKLKVRAVNIKILTIWASEIDLTIKSV